MSTREDLWTARLHVAVDDHPGALSFDVSSYVAAGRRRARRNQILAIAATVVAVAAVTALSSLGIRGDAPQPAGPGLPLPDTAVNGWVAVDDYRNGDDIYLVRPGEDARQLSVPGSDSTSEACPAWSPDGSRVVLGRYAGAWNRPSGTAELVIVPVGADGKVGSAEVIGLDGFEAREGFDAHPCATWAPDGRWVAFAAADGVWVVDTRTGTSRRLADLRPSDMEWRPGTDQLTIAGDTGVDRSAPVSSTPVTVYSLSTGELSDLGSVDAAYVTWSPDGRTLAYTGGESDGGQLWLVDMDGSDERLLDPDMGSANHGIGPVWSPAGDRIAYQRVYSGMENHEVVLVSVADGKKQVIEPPTTDGPARRIWYPRAVVWSPDGTTLLYAGWYHLLGSSGGDDGSGVITVPADSPTDATVLADGFGSMGTIYGTGWGTPQTWGRQPE
jgi:hypothetical protein